MYAVFPRQKRCCCACWDSFAFWMDQRNTQNNLPVFRLLYFSATVVYFVVMLGVAAGGIKRCVAAAAAAVVVAVVAVAVLVVVDVVDVFPRGRCLCASGHAGHCGCGCVRC